MVTPQTVRPSHESALRSLKTPADSSSGSSESPLLDVHAPSASASPPPSQTLDRRELELALALVAAAVLVLAAAALLLAHRRRRKALPTSAIVVHRGRSRSDPSLLADAASVDWFRTNGGGGGDSFCGSWEHPAVAASRLPAADVRLVRRVHRGAHADVFLARVRSRGGAWAAAKKPSARWLADVRHLDALFCEVRLLATLRHAHVLALVGVAWRSLLDVLVLTEFMGGGDLRALLWRFERGERAADRRPRGFDRDKLRIAAQVAAALAYLHAQTPRPLAHLALRAHNVLLSPAWTAKLSDLRAASAEALLYERPEAAGASRGLWSAPEVLRGERADARADVFSFGVLLAEMDAHGEPYPLGTEASGRATDPAVGREVGSAEYSALLARIASGRATVRFSSVRPLASEPETAAAVEELEDVRQARDAGGSSGGGGGGDASAEQLDTSPVVHREVARIGRACVAFDPACRPTAREVERELQALARALDAAGSRLRTS